MSEARVSASISVVPRERWQEAIEILLLRFPDDARATQRLALHSALAADIGQQAGLMGHFSGNELTAACWLQQQPGRVASLWPPGFAAQWDGGVAAALVGKAIEIGHRSRAVMMQSLLATDAGVEAQQLRDAGFEHIADLLYLVSVAGCFPESEPTSELEFVAEIQGAESGLERIVERTYAGTSDCPALDGVRAIGDVLEGYRGIGRYRPDLWLIARRAGDNVGCALVADHAPEAVWELVYMGIVPEARGKGLGLDVTRYVQWLARCAAVERLVLAVDAANDPAIAMYAAAGFVAWDRRSVFVRRLAG
jgi:ribosomal protein S18 acetylase RimI-like enzyme